MLQPKKPKHRKQMKSARRVNRVDTRGAEVSFGDFGLKAQEGGYVTARQIEAGRIALTRSTKRGGKVWIRIFPDKPLTSKPAETRMGKGKGATEQWVAEVRPGRILFEVTGIEGGLAKEALQKASAKLPLKCAIVERKQTLL